LAGRRAFLFQVFDRLIERGDRFFERGDDVLLDALRELPEAVASMHRRFAPVASGWRHHRQVTSRELHANIEQETSRAEETIAALDKSIKDLVKKRTPPGQQPAAGSRGECRSSIKSRAKNDPLASNADQQRTQRYGEMLKATRQNPIC